MYKIIKSDSSLKGQFKNSDFEKLDSFLVSSRNGCLAVMGQKISTLKIYDVVLARPMVSRIANNKYKKLLMSVTELLISDDDTGDAFRMALNQIEKFRQEVKNKYRMFLERKELNLMAKQLSTLQEEAKNRLLELQNSLLMDDTKGKSR